MPRVSLPKPPPDLSAGYSAFQCSLVGSQAGATTSPVDIARGWVGGPDGRGTLDILWSCTITTFLCSWSTLFLNVPGDRGSGHFHFLLYKARWMAFTILFPEMLTGLAAEQWRSARQSVEDFTKLQKEWETAQDEASHDKTSQDNLSATILENLMRIRAAPWNMPHAFFADMGGIILSFPDFQSIPISGHQVAFLVKKRYIQYPAIKEKEIWDKNKADSFARALTIIQISWFSVQCFARCAQQLGLTTLELTTLSFIFCTVQTLFFWFHKPLDVEEPIELHCSTPLHDIIRKEANEQSPKRYLQTPLDCLNPPISRTSLTAPFMFGIRAGFLQLGKPPKRLPAKTFSNATITPPRGLTPGDLGYAFIYVSSYFGIHLAAWNFFFPTETERILWRIASFVLLGLSTLYFAAFTLGEMGGAALYGKYVLHNNEVKTTMDLAAIMTPGIAFLQHLPIIILYFLARSYIIVEGFVALRMLSASTYSTVNWSLFVPHFG